MKIIGLDVGEKRIGVARADSSTKIAVPVGFVEVSNGTEWVELARIARLNNASWFVLGLPRSNEGNETKQSEYVRGFARTLCEKIPGARVRFQDESLTSVEAEKRLKARRKPYMRGDIDAEAASIILQDFIEQSQGSATRSEDTLPRARYYGAQSVSPVGGTDSSEGIPEPSTHNQKLKLEAAKAKHKMRKWPIAVGLMVVVGLIAGAVWGINWWQERERAKREYAEYVAAVAAQRAETFDFTILPGETIMDIKAKLIKLGYSEEEVEEAFNASYDFDFLAERPEGATLEGYLYGETYEFFKNASVKEILTRFLAGMEEVITANNLTARYAERGLSLFEGVTLASIVQKEAAPRDQPTVAQVFLSRLAYGWKLGSDVTVTYALNLLDPERTTYTDNSTALTVDSCYNTRMRTGLPCGPISNPALSALLAVAEPTDTSYLFFLTGDDGMMYYGYTEAEHNANAVKYCREMCAVSL